MLLLALAVAVLAAVRGLWSPCGLSMLSSLNPVSERARGHRFALTAAWYVGGAATGGALLGAVTAAGAAAVAALPVGTAWPWAAALVGALVSTASDSATTGFALPVHPRQVDERWLGRYRRWIYAGGFGLQIGTGFATYIMTAAVYLSALLAVLTARPWAAFAVGLTFGTVRGLGILVTATTRDPARLRRLLGTVERWGPASLRLCGLGSAGAAAVAAVLFARHVDGAGPVLVATAALLVVLVGAARVVRSRRRLVGG